MALPDKGLMLGMKKEDGFQALADFRKGILFILLVVVGSSIILFPVSKELVGYLCLKILKTNLVAYSIPETFFSLLKLTLYTSLFTSIPIIFYFLWKAFSPLFRLKGMTSSGGILLASIFLFYLGAFFCFFVALPNGVSFLMGYQSAQVKPMISVDKYVSFCTVFIFGFGATFELPLILALLSTLNLVKASFLTRNRRYAILLIAIIAAVVTPTPDVFNMGLMGVPMYLLFEIGVILVKLIERKRARAKISLAGK
jgi:sec-independent protein translocase protein TatC